MEITAAQPEQAKRKQALIDRIRILRPDAVALMPDGTVQPYGALLIRVGDADRGTSAALPLLVLNPDEMNLPAARSLIRSGFYRRHYAEALRNNEASRKAHQRGAGYLAEALSAYDGMMAALDDDRLQHMIDRAAAQAKRLHASHPPAPDALGSYFDADAKLNEFGEKYYLGLMDKWRRRWARKKIGRASDEIKRALYQGAAPPVASDEWEKIERYFRFRLSELPESLLLMFDAHGGELVAMDAIELHGDGVVHGQLVCSMNAVLSLFDIDTTIAEELFHYADERMDGEFRLGLYDALFSRYDSRKESMASRGFGDYLMQEFHQKAPIFSAGGHYGGASREQKGMEFLVNLFHLERTELSPIRRAQIGKWLKEWEGLHPLLAPEVPDGSPYTGTMPELLARVLPKSWPHYQTFMRALDAKADELALPAASMEAKPAAQAEVIPIAAPKPDDQPTTRIHHATLMPKEQIDKRALIAQMRILQPDAIAITQDKRVVHYRSLIVAGATKGLKSLPICVLNPDELTADGIRKVIQSGYYTDQFYYGLRYGEGYSSPKEGTPFWHEVNRFESISHDLAANPDTCAELAQEAGELLHAIHQRYDSGVERTEKLVAARERKKHLPDKPPETSTKQQRAKHRRAKKGAKQALDYQYTMIRNSIASGFAPEMTERERELLDRNIRELLETLPMPMLTFLHQVKGGIYMSDLVDVSRDSWYEGYYQPGLFHTINETDSQLAVAEELFHLVDGYLDNYSATKLTPLLFEGKDIKPQYLAPLKWMDDLVASSSEKAQVLGDDEYYKSMTPEYKAVEIFVSCFHLDRLPLHDQQRATIGKLLKKHFPHGYVTDRPFTGTMSDLMEKLMPEVWELYQDFWPKLEQRVAEIEQKNEAYEHRLKRHLVRGIRGEETAIGR